MNHLDFQEITINAQRLMGRDMVAYCHRSEEAFLQSIGDFLEDWLNEDPCIRVQTSGSTGAPKQIDVRKTDMLHSAAATGLFFDFQPGQIALLCLPVSYIAGKMMVVRALYSQLNLICIPPVALPLATLPTGMEIDFAPLTPMQLHGVTDTAQVHTLLLGGGPVSPALERSAQQWSAAVYHGYGMTETLSHVALRRVNGPGRSEAYTALPGVSFWVDARQCLGINVPFLKAPVLTNDVVELQSETSFVWKGRADHVINSGGIKLFPEEIEKKLAPLLAERFFVAGLPDERLGEKLVLVLEAAPWPEAQQAALRERMKQALQQYERPQDLLFCPGFTTTTSGKVQRQDTLQRSIQG